MTDEAANLRRLAIEAKRLGLHRTAASLDLDADEAARREAVVKKCVHAETPCVSPEECERDRECYDAERLSRSYRKTDAPPPPAPDDLARKVASYLAPDTVGDSGFTHAKPIVRELWATIEALRAELAAKDRMLDGARGCLAEQTARAEAAEADAKRLREAVQHLAYYECYTREGEEPPHVRMMQEARAALAQGGNDG